MFVTHTSLPENARIWIYQSNRAFTKNEIDVIHDMAKEFVANWTRHGKDLKGSCLIKHNQFIVLAIDENFNSVSGCSIDASIHFIKKIESLFAIDLLNKLQISFKDGENINVVSMIDFQNFVKEGRITKDTIVFNNLVATKKELESKWEVPASESWHQRFLQKHV